MPGPGAGCPLSPSWVSLGSKQDQPRREHPAPGPGTCHPHWLLAEGSCNLFFLAGPCQAKAEIGGAGVLPPNHAAPRPCHRPLPCFPGGLALISKTSSTTPLQVVYRCGSPQLALIISSSR